MCNHENREAAMVVLDPGTPERHGRDGVWCDPCLVPLIRALNEAGMKTAASCCGHGQSFGWVMLHDGRDIVIYRSHEANLAVNSPALLAGIRASGESPTPPEMIDEEHQATYDATFRCSCGAAVALDANDRWVHIAGARPLPSQTPSREAIARALHADDVKNGRAADDFEQMNADTFGWYFDNADAVLALLASNGVNAPSPSREAIAEARSLLTEWQNFGTPLDPGAPRKTREYSKFLPRFAATIAALLASTGEPALIECPHWEPGRITMRRGCTACAATPSGTTGEGNSE